MSSAKFQVTRLTDKQTIKQAKKKYIYIDRQIDNLNEQGKNQINKASSFIKVPREKNSAINLTKESKDFYNENHKTLVKLEINLKNVK